MSLIELLLFVLGIFLSALVGRCFYAQIGWWGVLPAPIGFGSIYGLILLLDRIFPPRAIREMRQAKKNSTDRNGASEGNSRESKR